MAEKQGAEKTQKQSFFKGLRTEFRKIVWPSQDTVIKDTIYVVVGSAVLGLVIAILDFVMKWALNFII